MAERIRVIVTGALGKMGSETVKAVINDEELDLAAMVDVKANGESLADIAGLKGTETNNLKVENDLDAVLARIKPDIMIDFTNPQAVFSNAKTALEKQVTCVIGTTGMNDLELKQLEKLANDNQVGVAVIPNFAIGAVLMMKFAKEAAHYFPDVEIIELHHDQKMDAPSGTAIKTAQMITENRAYQPPANAREFEKIPGSRGGNLDQVHIHSVRLPGLIAHQEVIFGGMGQGLKIRHDSYNRVGFMQGVLMVVKKMIGRQGLVYGMDNLL
ncbi:MAG: 4-hydroxy-tetrahydrodipicolinate reductase [Syntrophomonadaceae bacterium]|nr:4-hydroxy-tetrahydrodipicolinate reductase [Syntrophomonadaceae bacterium]MDD3888295.1 4-hydroxy-tetrahydrodipicolinate reductase [Syntrophomonadaceae bacterium]MDD4548802.1 4-hydroxy-tetrahydrodipicolinate reductase [Syntrophomonadaceae bacterium]